MPSMLAFEAHERGGPENLHVERVDRPEPSRGEALVEVHAAGITPTELTWDTTWSRRRRTTTMRMSTTC
jgi:NADPH:quinone reductase-like Zn-dependent oxidoreductase